MESGDIQSVKPRSRGMRALDLPGPRLLPAAIVPLTRSIGLPVLALAVALDVLLFAASRVLGWPCWSSICILAN